MTKGLNIQTKLIIMGLTLTLIPTIVVGTFMYRRSRADIESAVLKNLEVLSTAKQNEIDAYFEGLKAQGHFLAGMGDVYQSLKALRSSGYDLMSRRWLSMKDGVLGAVAKKIEELGFHIFFITSPEGRVVWSTDGSIPEGTDLSGRDYIQGALKGEITFSNFFYSDAVKTSCIAVGVPVFDESEDNTLLGVAAIVVTEEDLSAIIHSGIDRLGKTADAYLVDAAGTLLTNMRDGEYSSNTALSKSISGWAVTTLADAVSKNDSSFSGTSKYRDYRGVPVLGSVTAIKIGQQLVGLVIEVEQGEALASVANLKTFTVTAGIIMAAIASLAAVAFGRSVARPLNLAVGMLRDIAKGEGDLTKRLEIQTRDEIGELARWFNAFVDYLQGLVKEMAKTSDGLAATGEELTATSEESRNIAQQISETAEQVAKGAQDQSAAAADTATSVDHLATIIEKVAEGAQAQHTSLETVSSVLEEVNRVFTEVVDALEKFANVAWDNTKAAQAGMDSVKSLTASMDNIRRANESAASTVQELHDLSQSIYEIVDIIDDIADQTNLLALNAAIEAARAGEYGRGFAVVADEVRKLAERSLSETKNIRDLISRVAAAIEKTVNSIEASSGEIENGHSVTGDTRKALEEIYKAAEQTQGVVSDLASSFGQLKESLNRADRAVQDISASASEYFTAAQEMTKTSQHVRSLIESMAAVSEETTASLEEVSASIKEMARATEQVSVSAQELATTSEKLQEIVRKFKV
ncbi:MAG TPA: HAMP domain-containing protein [Firmicutes bacterium]|nr:HAMP domain-containing protein [Candidatus Fermentithermobacillaceae bacterium]